MPDPAALLAAVVAAPDDETPRLAYSDAIAKSDPARAELIKLQIVLARWRKAHENPDTRPEASARERVLLDQGAAAWAADVKPLVDKCQFLRGFVEVVTLDAAKFLASAPELYRRAPILHLDLTNVKPVAAQLFQSPHLARIKSLNLRANKLGDAEAVLVAKSPYLRKLEWLDLSSNEIGEAGLDALVATDRLPRLGYLRFEDNTAADPTPRHADEYDAESAQATALQAKHGKRAWLDARTRAEWPPPRDAVD
jgi:uncharacterized protein (TIGR02996 family)